MSASVSGARPPGPIRTAIVLLPILAVLEIALGLYLAANGLLAVGMASDASFIWVIVLGVVIVACGIIALSSILALRRGGRTARLLVTLTTVVAGAAAIWVMVPLMGSVPLALETGSQGAFLILSLVIDVVLLALALAVLLLVWVAPAARAHFTRTA